MPTESLFTVTNKSLADPIMVLPLRASVKLFVANAPPASIKKIASPAFGAAGNVHVTAADEVSTAYLPPATTVVADVITANPASPVAIDLTSILFVPVGGGAVNVITCPLIL